MKLSSFKNYKQYLNQNILCIDYGEKVTGFASFTPGRDPYPLTAGRYVFKDNAELIQTILQKCYDESVEIIVLGLPIRSDGSDSEQTVKVRSFAQALEANTRIQIHLQDEHLSTQSAKDRMRSSAEYNFSVNLEKIDEMSAIIILEDFIRSSGT